MINQLSLKWFCPCFVKIKVSIALLAGENGNRRPVILE
jgi:hypothetical protein